MIAEQDDRGKVKVSLTEDREVPEEVRGSLQTYVSGLPMPKKVELATRGNRDVRKILSRDANHLVARAVANSPRLSELDVLEYSGSSLTNEDVLRAIGESREWSKNRRVKMLLVSNPRTPVSLAMRFLGHLSVQELSLLAANRNIPAAVSREAKRRVVVSRK
ncbi:MAG TPA: hypothetical protein DD658_06510 [Deltaproteobacteria bacterium]|nr:MAG: hypothetical protein A2X88_04705 [Deltaproteobacteria bacterium GWC2_65_14]HBO69790.1 hypothetical protein [Deltaproteobacteria bacterium]